MPLASQNGSYKEIVEEGLETRRPEGAPRKSRPSLSERAIETLQNIPPSPALRRRRSSFFNPESPMRPPSSGNVSSRPGSSHDASMRPSSRSNGSRPSSRSGPNQIPINFRASTNTFNPPTTSYTASAITKRPSLANLRTPSTNRQSIGPGTLKAPTKLPSPDNRPSQRQRSPSPVRGGPAPVIKSGSKTISGRPLKHRASIGLFRKPSLATLEQSVELDRIGFGRNVSTLSNTSSEETSTTSKASRATTMTSKSPEPREVTSRKPIASRPISKPPPALSAEARDTTPRKSSLALRDQIAKAKAAKRAALEKSAPGNSLGEETEISVVPAESFDFGLSGDPFNQQIGEDGAKGLLKKRIQAARSDGRLNIAAMGFKQIPDEIMTMYDMGTNDGSWAESVDLTRFVAAGNEIEIIQDEVFPDVDPRDTMDDEDAKGNQFGGLETLDLHGNLLVALPRGLRRLELLTTLNISNNKLDNGCLEIITQMTTLRDLKLGNNGLFGALDSSITSLTSLEVLDVQRNALTSLPDSLRDLVRLRVLNLTENRLTGLPFGSLQHLPLMELLAAKNKLTGTLIGSDVESLPHLQILDVTANAITGLTISDSLNLPSLHQLSLSSNRLTSIPDMASWISLRTLTAEDNNIDSIPEGFVNLSKLRNVDFSGNNIRTLDDRIGAMDSLDIFRISGNPLREKKFSGMTTEDLKRALKARMEPEELEADKDTDGFYSASASPVSPNRPTSSNWPVGAGGVLDRSNMKLQSLNPVAASHVAASNQIKILELHHNMFKEIPSSIGFFAATLTTLNLAHNELNSDSFMKEDLHLPALKELNLSSNTFNSLQPLFQRLEAPNLIKLDISFNRLTSLPQLRPYFPSLVTLLASNNTIRELSPESIKGLQTLDCSSNDINSLNARIGLLGGPGGLQRLDVSGNRFRVPKYTVLEKGTEATLAWLRDRIPGSEGGSVDAVSELD